MQGFGTLARAKVNLFLHVTGRRADGYHLLESLTVFPECGDWLEVEPSSGLSLSIAGPFGDALEVGAANLVLKAAMALEPKHRAGTGAALNLLKNLPIASGIGGGSADAAAALCLLNRLWVLGLGERDLERIALSLGADVPVCIGSRSRIMRGIGDDMSAAPDLPDCHIVLVNPLRQVSTQGVFARRGDTPFSATVTMPEGWGSFDGLADWLEHETRNDLEEAALSLAPEIARCRDALASQSGARVARMSGSGATVFALFADAVSARDAAAALRKAYAGWWVEDAQVSRSTT